MMDRHDKNFCISMGCVLGVGISVGYITGRHLYKNLVSKIGPIDPMGHPSCQLAVDARQLFLKGREGGVKWGTDWEKFKDLVIKGDATSPALKQLHKQFVAMPHQHWSTWAMDLAEKPIPDIKAVVEKDLRIPLEAQCMSQAGAIGSFAGTSFISMGTILLTTKCTSRPAPERF